MIAAKSGKSNKRGSAGKRNYAVAIPQRKGRNIIFEKDEFIRPETTPEILGKLQPASRIKESVTAENASELNDGSGAILVAGASTISKLI